MFARRNTVCDTPNIVTEYGGHMHRLSWGPTLNQEYSCNQGFEQKVY